MASAFSVEGLGFCVDLGKKNIFIISFVMEVEIQKMRMYDVTDCIAWWPCPDS